MKNRYKLEILRGGHKRYFKNYSLHRDSPATHISESQDIHSVSPVTHTSEFKETYSMSPAFIWIYDCINTVCVNCFQDGIYQKGYTIKGIDTTYWIEYRDKK